MERNILLHAQHLPGVLNTIADEESRTWSDRSEWKFSPILFQEINHLLGPLSTDLFASRLSSQLPIFVSWKPDALAVATDAFTQDWNTLPGKLYANPPWGLIGRVLSLVHSQGVQELVLESPTMVSHAPPNAGQSTIPHPTVSRHITASVLEQSTRHYPTISRAGYIRQQYEGSQFLRQLQTLSSHHGETNLQSHTIPALGNGASWCAKQNRNPFSGPISNVTNFLARLPAQLIKFLSISYLFNS